MLAVRPVDLEEVCQAISLAHEALDSLLKAPSLPAHVAPPEIAAGQENYALGQRRNQHTLRMLAGFIGMHSARQFVDEVLFPLTSEIATGEAAAIVPHPGVKRTECA